METVSTLTALASLFQAMGGWEFGVLAVLIIAGPVVLVLLVSKSNKELRDEIKAQMEADNKRFEVVVRNYEDNVLLVKDYLKLAGDLSTVIHLNTEAMTRLVDRIDSNHYCPMVRKKGNPDE